MDGLASTRMGFYQGKVSDWDDKETAFASGRLTAIELFNNGHGVIAIR